MPPSLVHPNDDAAPDGIDERERSAVDRLPMAGAGAVILGLSIVAWIVTIQGARMIATLIG